MNTDIAFNLLNFATGGLATLLSVGLAVVGLMYVRRVHTFAGLAFAGAGLLGAFGSVIRRLASLAGVLGGGTIIYTLTQIFTTLLAILTGALIPLGIFLLANAVKQRANYPR